MWVGFSNFQRYLVNSENPNRILFLPPTNPQMFNHRKKIFTSAYDEEYLIEWFENLNFANPNELAKGIMDVPKGDLTWNEYYDPFYQRYSGLIDLNELFACSRFLSLMRVLVEEKVEI